MAWDRLPESRVSDMEVTMPLQSQGGASRRSKLIAAAFFIIAGFFLLSEHRAHLFGYLPWLLALACPIMHMFHHHGHKNHEPRTSNTAGERK